MPKYFLLFFLLFYSSLNAQSAASLIVKLGISNQRIIVTDAQFESELPYPADTKEQLVQLLNNSFATLDSLIRKENPQWCIGTNCLLLDNFQADYLIFTEGEGTIEDIVNNYFDNLEDWVLSELFDEYIFDVLQTNVFNGSPLTLTGQEFEDEDFESLTFTFPVKAPIQTEKLTLLWLDNDTVQTKTKGRILKGLDGQLFFENKIINSLSNYFFNLNFQPTYYINPNQIRIAPSRISRFLVKTKEKKAVDQIAYQLLPHALYKAFLKLPKDSIRIESGRAEAIYQFNLINFFQQDFSQLPILLTNNLAQAQTQLVQQTYALNVSQTPNDLLDEIDPFEQELYVDLIINQLDTDSDTTNVPAATPNVTNGNNDNDNTAFDNELTDLKERALTEFKRNFFGLGLDINITDETRLKTVFHRLMKDGSNFSAELAYAFNEDGFDNGGFLFSGSYAKDYLFFNTLKKRLSLQISAGSDFTANRVFFGEASKERRLGAKIRTEIDWYRDQHHRLFKSHLTIADERVTLDIPTVSIAPVNILSTQWGNVFYATSPVKLLTTRFNIENALNFNWLGVKGEPLGTFFTTGTVRMNLNQKLPRGMAFDLTAYNEWASSKTPFFEQVGHQVATNRGFKQDAVIGRNLFGGTIEFWTPLPRFGDKQSGINQYFYKHLRLAIFSDFSQYNQLLDSSDKVNLWSPGIGFRLLMGEVQVNFDWALRQTKATNLDGGSQFSLNLILNTPFQ